MKILAIETSCDETAISIVDFKSKKSFKLLSDSILSQIEIHKKYGGVFPAMAKREHLNNIFPLLLASLENAKMLEKRKTKKKVDIKKLKKLKKIFDRDEHNLENILKLFSEYKKPSLSAVAITYGPGLEIALWTGFNVARGLAEIWGIKLIPVNHMEGHIYSSLIKTKNKNTFQIEKLNFPALALLISGGHTELVLIKTKEKYKIIGSTLDDAVGEAYDKSARLLGIDYPGGPEISKLAESYEKKGAPPAAALPTLPRPMLNHPNFDFSFSGLKTAVLYLVKKQKKINKNFKEALAAEFENAVAEVIIKKSQKAIEKYNIKSFVVGGGVSANNRLRAEFKKMAKNYPDLNLYLPDKKYTGDNALMIAVAGYYNLKNNTYPKNIKKVHGNLKLK